VTVKQCQSNVGRYMTIPNIAQSGIYYIWRFCSGCYSFQSRDTLSQVRCLESGHSNSMRATTWPCRIRHTSFSNIIHIADETLGWSVSSPVATNTGGLSVPAHRLSLQSLIPIDLSCCGMLNPTVERAIICW